MQTGELTERCGGKVEKTQTERQERHRQRVLPVDNETLRAPKDYIRRGTPGSLRWQEADFWH